VLKAPEDAPAELPQKRVLAPMMNQNPIEERTGLEIPVICGLDLEGNHQLHFRDHHGFD